METIILDFLSAQWWYALLLGVSLVLVIKYRDKKEALYREEIKEERNQNRLTTERFIAVSEKSIAVISDINAQISPIHPKLHEMHEDIKTIKSRRAKQ